MMIDLARKRVVFLFVTQFVIQLVVLHICNKKVSDYFYIPLVINIITFGLMTKFMNMEVKSNKLTLLKHNILISGIAFLIIIVERLLIENITDYTMGPIIVLFLYLLVFLLVGIGIYISVYRKCDNLYSICFTILNIVGVISAICYIINQHHMIYTNINELNEMMFKSICIYMETLILSICLGLVKK